MDTKFVNSENTETSEPHISILQLTDKLDLRRGENNIALSNLSIYYSQKNIKITYNNNISKISGPPWNDKFELPDGSYSVSDSQDYFEHILKKHEENIDNPSVKVYVNKIKNRITFKVKTGYNVQLLTPEKMKLHRSTENRITKGKKQ